jgi:hypothetical protein
MERGSLAAEEKEGERWLYCKLFCRLAAKVAAKGRVT